jgi:hypothetical protein
MSDAGFRAARTDQVAWTKLRKRKRKYQKRATSEAKRPTSMAKETYQHRHT